MWIILGVGAIVTAILNVLWTIQKQDAKRFCFISLSLTALTACAQYSLVKKWVIKEDWSALMDVVPGMMGVLLVFVIASIIINSISVVLKKHDEAYERE